MALVHRATLSPSKQELVEAWLPSRPWASGLTVGGKIAEYRFDDPAGEVGVETILWQTSEGPVVQTPLTYRAAPLSGADEHLIGTCDHSVLGQRWVYDGCGDPVWATTLATAILTGGSQSNMYFQDGDERIDVPPRMEVRGSGSPETVVPQVSSIDSTTDDGPVTVVQAGGVRLVVARTLGATLDGDGFLTGQVGDDGQTLMLASLAAA